MENLEHKPSVSIIVLAYNNVEYTKLSIDSLYKHTAHINFELITVNNGSNDDTEAFFNALPNKKKISISQNCGVAKAFNEGLKLAEGVFTVFLSNDVVLTPKWLENLLKCAQSDDKIGMVAPVCNFASYMQQVNLSYNNSAELVHAAEQYNQSDPKKWEERLRLINYTSLMRTALLRTLEGMDEIYIPCVFEDDDLSFRIRRAGYRLILARDTYVHHFGAITKKSNYLNKHLVERNHRIFFSRFGVDAWDDTGIDVEIPDLVDYTRTQDVNILGIGSRCGGTMLQIKNRFRENGVMDVRLWGLTAEEKYLTDLRTIYDRVVCEPFENIAHIYVNQKFDCIILDHDLRRIDDPESFIINLKARLKEDGQLIIPVTNELFYVRILNWLNNKSDSASSKMLSSHLNLEKLCDFLQKNGFEQLKLNFSHDEPSPEDMVYVESLNKLMKQSPLESSELTKILSTKRFILTVKGHHTVRQVLLYPGYDYWQNGIVFDDRSLVNSLGVDTGENIMWELREEFDRNGYKMSTLDNPTDIDDAEFVLFYDVPKYYGNHCFLGIYHSVYKGKIYFEEFLNRKAQGKTKAKLVVILNEPPFVMPENYDRDILDHFDLIFTYDDDLVDNHKYFKYYTPQPESVANPYARDYSAKKLCTFVGTNKSSCMPGELYTERRKALLFFGENHRDEFDFYGKSWEDSGYASYKGPVANKLEILSGYKFCICYENGCQNGWISEKIFDAFFAGCVPIYLGAPNISDYIPGNTFIDKRDFSDYARLYDFISRMDERLYNEYLRNIELFLKSDHFQKFTRRSVSQNIVKMLMANFSAT